MASDLQPRQQTQSLTEDQKIPSDDVLFEARTSRLTETQFNLFCSDSRHIKLKNSRTELNRLINKCNRDNISASTY
ncbi:unnamed protein product, partial [marine sediment metagenome]